MSIQEKKGTKELLTIKYPGKWFIYDSNCSRCQGPIDKVFAERPDPRFLDEKIENHQDCKGKKNIYLKLNQVVHHQPPDTNNYV